MNGLGWVLNTQLSPIQTSNIIYHYFTRYPARWELLAGCLAYKDFRLLKTTYHYVSMVQGHHQQYKDGRI